MNRKIDVGEDKNVLKIDPKAENRPQLSFLVEELAKTSDEAINDARKISWDRWLNSEPLIMGHVDETGTSFLFFISELVKNRVVLLDIWDYTLLPSLRSLSYVLEWHERYGGAGLITIGVHCPMFEFGKDKKNILDAVRDLGITYPVVLDSNFEIWRSLENRFWPRRILIDSNGKISLDSVGEGEYDVFEKHIQTMLREVSPGLACPPVMKPVRPIDEPEYVIPSTTPEVFFGLSKTTRLGGTQVPRTVNEEIHYKDLNQGNRVPELVYLDGPWVTGSESVYGGSTFKGHLQLTINFTGTDVHLVARSRPKNLADIPQAIRAQINIDKKPVSDEYLGKDAILNEYRRSVVVLRDPKLYHVVSQLEHKSHELTISIETSTSDTLELFAIFFEHSGKHSP